MTSSLEIVPGLSYANSHIKEDHTTWMKVCNESIVEFDVESKCNNKRIIITKINKVYPFGRPERSKKFTGIAMGSCLKSNKYYIDVRYELGCEHMEDIYRDLYGNRVEILGTTAFDGSIMMNQLTDVKNNIIYSSEYICNDVIIDGYSDNIVKVHIADIDSRVDFEINVLNYSDFFDDVQYFDLIWKKTKWNIEYDISKCSNIYLRHIKYIEYY
jgi:hypothetical protein